MARVVLFIDAQNFYRGARRAFFDENAAFWHGQIRPMALAKLLSNRDPNRSIERVRIYTGRPDATFQPRAHGANVRQSTAWTHAGCDVIHRPLRYPAGWQTVSSIRPQEKGIDVAMALDVVGFARSDAMDVGIVCSGDTDLLPAIEMALATTDKRIEVASWSGPGSRQRLSLAGRNLWCHWLQRADYDAIRDETDYTRSR